MVFSLFGGVFADRLDRRKMLLASQYIQMTCAFLLAILFVTHTVKVWHILSLSFIVGLRPVVRRPRLLRSPAHPGAHRRLIQRHRHELDSIQPGARHRPDHRRSCVLHTRRHLVFHSQRNFLPRRHRLVVFDPRKIRARQNAAACPEQHGRRNSLHTPEPGHERVSLARVLHHPLRFFPQRILAGHRAERFSPRPGDLHALARLLRSRLHLRRLNYCGHRKSAKAKSASRSSF